MNMHKNCEEMGHNCRKTWIIKLLTTKAAAVPNISSTMRDFYGQATLLVRDIRRRTCSRHSSWTAWTLKMRSTGCRRSHFVYYYIINSASTNYMEKSHFSTTKLLNPTINYLIIDFKPSPCSECYMLSSGCFTVVWSLYANVSEHSVCSIFIRR
jgi:hypothetical protein